MPIKRRRIVHVVYSFAVGGLENVIVQLINRLPAEEYEHIILSLTHISDFSDRLSRQDVRLIALNKPPGHAIPLYPKIYRLLRELAPDVLHTCNLAALEIVPLGWLARVPLRIHAEHGWDAHDPDGRNPRYRRLRKVYRPFVSHYIAVSHDIDRYLDQHVHVPETRRHLIANGVDTTQFSPRSESIINISGCPFSPGEHWIIGTVGRLQTVKNQPLLARAFTQLVAAHPEARQKLRLIIVGEGPLRQEIELILAEVGCSELAWLPGSRNDIAGILGQLDCFVLPSQAEGTSCTLQEAMASALPVVATAVGGTPELILNNENGQLVCKDDVSGLSEAIWSYYSDSTKARNHGRAAREMALARFSLDSMIARYDLLFSGQAGQKNTKPDVH